MTELGLGCLGNVVMGHQEITKVLFVFRLDLFDQGFGADVAFFSFEHDSGAMGVIGTNIDAFMAAHALEPDADIGLDMFQQMTKMNGAIGVG